VIEIKKEMLESKICNACGTQFPPSRENPDRCPICEDDRQYVPDIGQTWSSPVELMANHTVEIRRFEDGFFDLRGDAKFRYRPTSFSRLFDWGQYSLGLHPDTG
jgi:hypothetical protein